jgi:2'-5' RNA ligase
MRTFIAIPIPESGRKMLAKLQDDLRSCRADVRYVKPGAIHLTLKFLGEIDPEIVPDLTASLENASRALSRFELLLRGLGCFPNHRSPRVAWCGIEAETENLLELQKQVDAACEAHGFPAEDRPFHPHLTLGRIKGKRNLQALSDCIKMGSDLECRFRVDHFNIYRSTLKPQGAVYTVLKTIPLGE